MLIKIKREWELPESAATPESVYWNRRHFLRGLAAGPALLGGAALAAGKAFAADEVDPSAALYPAPRNTAYEGGRPLTDEEAATTYNNFYEFGSHKQISKVAQNLKIRPWTVTIDGAVDKPMSLAIDDLLAKMPLEERVYRHRCVEAWAMTVPWTGFQLSHLIDLAQPRSDAKYVTMQTFLDKEIAPGQRQHWYPWPYVEGLTMAEARNELSFIATGIYGRPMPKQNGAPLRLAVPWKYGFKHITSLVRFTFSATRPKGVWEVLQSREYGFWANVNPEVPHPRWSQATERLLGSDERVPTQLYNGYAAQVADLYRDLSNERLFM
jgi:sulfoxide reductase catalytic subunit YedY